MTKDIMLRISGVQFPDGEENSEEMEVITSGSYFEKRAYGVRKRQKKRILLRHPIWKIPGRDLRNTSGCQRKRRQH